MVHFESGQAPETTAHVADTLLGLAVLIGIALLGVGALAGLGFAIWRVAGLML